MKIRAQAETPSNLVPLARRAPASAELRLPRPTRQTDAALAVGSGGRLFCSFSGLCLLLCLGAGTAPAAEPLELAQAAPETVDDLFGLEPESGTETAPGDAADPGSAEELPGVVQERSQAEPEGSAPAEAPGSAEDLFGLEEPAPEPAAPPPEQAEPDEGPGSAEDLFGIEPAEPAEAEAPAREAAREDEVDIASRVFGFYQSELAYTYAQPTHFQKFRNVLELGTSGQGAGGVRWLLSGRIIFDPSYALHDFYPEAVQEDQQWEAQLRETYIDISRGDWEFRLGRQHIIWGEMVGLFFADVISARDLREFVLPDFDMLRIPQWAVRTEYFKGDFHAEFVFIPYMSYDDIGKPGAEYFPFVPPPLGLPYQIRGDNRPADNLSNAGYGVRFNYLRNGWDGALFYYTAPSLSPAFRRELVMAPTPTLLFTPEREREYQVGATIAKDFAWALFKAEAIYTQNRLFETTTLAEADGVVPQDFIDYVASLEWSFAGDTRFTLQGYQRHFFDHDDGIVPDEVESGFAILLTTRWFHPDIEPELLYVSSLNRTDSMLQAKITWELAPDWRLVAGTDVFTGDPIELFGRFDDTDRVYVETRYSF